MAGCIHRPVCPTQPYTSANLGCAGILPIERLCSIRLYEASTCGKRYENIKHNVAARTSSTYNYLRLASHTVSIT